MGAFAIFHSPRTTYLMKYLTINLVVIRYCTLIDLRLPYLLLYDTYQTNNTHHGCLLKKQQQLQKQIQMQMQTKMKYLPHSPWLPSPRKRARCCHSSGSSACIDLMSNKNTQMLRKINFFIHKILSLAMKTNDHFYYHCHNWHWLYLANSR